MVDGEVLGDDVEVELVVVDGEVLADVVEVELVVVDGEVLADAVEVELVVVDGEVLAGAVELLVVDDEVFAVGELGNAADAVVELPAGAASVFALCVDEDAGVPGLCL